MSTQILQQNIPLLMQDRTQLESDACNHEVVKGQAAVSIKWKMRYCTGPRLLMSEKPCAYLDVEYCKEYCPFFIWTELASIDNVRLRSSMFSRILMPLIWQ